MTKLFYTNPETVVNTNTAGNQTLPSIAYLTDGGYIVVWSGAGGNPNDLNMTGVFGQRYNGEGKPVGGNFVVSDAWGTGFKFSPTVAGLQDGGFVVTWRGLDTSGASAGVYMRKFNANGTPTMAETLVPQVTAGSQDQQSIVAVYDGGFVITWTDRDRDGSGQGVFGRKFNINGNPATNDFQVNTTTAGSQASSKVTALPNGDFVVAWTHSPDSGALDVYVQRFSAEGAKIGPETNLVTVANSLEFFPSIAGLSDGGYVVSWQSFAPGAQSITVRAQKYSAAGQPVGNFVEVAGGQHSVTGLQDGGFVIASSTGTAIEVSRFNSAGALVRTEVPLLGGQSNNRPSIVLMADGSVIVAWDQDSATSGTDVVHARFREADFLSDASEITSGTQGADLMEGFGGNDELFAAGGDDILDGGAGGDLLVGGAGFDEVTYASSILGVSLNLTAGSHGGDANGDRFESIERFRLTRHGDRFVGSAAEEIVLGLNGDDHLAGMGGADHLDGGLGDDTLEGGAGADFLNGGEGNDEASYARETQAVGINLATQVHSGTAAGDVYASIERFELTRFDDSFVGSAQSERVLAGGGNDRLDGRGGNDALDGGEGNDLLDGGSGADEMIGGAGNDIYIVDDAGDLIIELAGGGTDLVKASVSHALANDVETLRLIGRGNAAATGNGLNNLLVGNDGNNLLNGGAGDDRIRAGRGVDSVEGGAGFDTLVLGGARSDYSFFTLNGVDYLFGRSGGARVSGVEQVEFADRALGFESLRTSAVQFDGLNYIASHRDLALSLGRDAAAGTAHFISTGFAEGRSPMLFDGLRYAASHADLIAAFGTDRDGARDHYLRNGAAEGRAFNSFDPLRYVASHADLIASIRTDADAAARHYIQFGFKEGRGTSFDPLRYVASYGDLIASRGTDADAALSHYIRFGFAESRRATFDALQYGATNADLARTFGNNVDALTRHYIDLGFDEGRAVSGFNPVSYLLSYSDLGNAGLGVSGALQHWLRNGVNEARSGDTVFGREQLSHSLAVGQTLTGLLDTAGDKDWFQMNLSAGQRVTINLGSESFNPSLQLHDATGRLIAFDLDSGPNDDALITFSANQAGLFYLVVAGENAVPLGDYSLAMM